MLIAVLSVFVAAALAPLVVRLSRRAAGWGLALVPAAVFAYFVQLLPAVEAGGAVRVSYEWVPGLDVALSFYVDGLSLFFALLVTGIGALIVVYAGGYMHGSDKLGRFFSQLLLFMGAMLGLVVADNLIAFFVFFELTSLASFLLIGFYHGQEDSRVAARKALVVTGGGGLALLAGLLLLQQVTGTYEISEMLSQGALVTGHPLYPWILGCVLAGAFTKSAQFPFHFWLPAAMAGPTPVSAYLHSATMVKAGVFLLARLHPVLAGPAAWTIILVSVGGFTMVLTAWLALRHTDLKQILAYTTTMVLGLLVMLLGVGTTKAIEAAIVFTLVHALYKGALFMIAGNVDHETGTRNVRELGGLRTKMPITTAAGLLAALSMAGIPLLFGFIGKEEVYAAALDMGSGLGLVVLAASVLANVALVAAGLVVGLRPFFGEPRAALTLEPHEAPASMWLGPAVLAAGSLTFGLVPGLMDGVLGAAGSAVLQETHALHLALWHGFNAALVASLVTFALGFGLYAAWDHLQPSRLMAGLSRTLGDGPAAAFERGLYELARGSHASLRVLQDGRLRHYLLVIFATAVVLAGGALLTEMGSLRFADALGTVRYYEGMLALVIVGSAVVATRARSRFVAILALSVAGYGVAMIYLFFGAPDLSMTQFAIETLSIILLVLVLANIPRLSFEEHRGGRIRDGVVACGVGALMTTLMLLILRRPLDLGVSEFMAAKSYTEAQGHNIVNVILVDFRGVDTMGEITVLTMAGLGVYALMRFVRPGDTANGEGDSEMDLSEEPRPEDAEKREADERLEAETEDG